MAPKQPKSAVGINAGFIKSSPQEFLIETGAMGHVSLVKTQDRGETLFRIEQNPALGFRARFIDAKSGEKLFDMMKTDGMQQYFAYHSNDEDKHILDINIESGGKLVEVSFANVADDGRQVRLEYKSGRFRKSNEIKWDELPIAEMKEDKLGESIKIAPTVDPLPVIAMFIAICDLGRRKSRGQILAGATNDNYGGAMGNAAFTSGIFGGLKKT